MRSHRGPLIVFLFFSRSKSHAYLWFLIIADFSTATLKFIVVILAAGMVAFIGAVICIIAAVHGGSPSASASAAQPLSDNQSLPQDRTGQMFPSGSVAKAGPRDALHGTDSSSRERGGPEAPTFYGLTGLGTTGGSEQQVTYSRLICTPVPAGECDTKNFQQQADDPSLYAGEDWGYLRTTAEELRQTALQQKDEILTDQKTIRELTGKLSECESGLKGRKVPGRRDAPKEQKDQVMMRDDAGPSMRSGHAVEELAHAITQMKDRIEKLESELTPPAFNHTKTSSQKASGSAHKSSHARAATTQRRMEDLEGELKRKIKLLEEERKALRKEAHKHQEHIDYGLDTIEQRISSLEKGLLENKFPEGYQLSFPVRGSSMYAVFKQEIPSLHALTVCMWLRPAKSIMGTAFSYAVSDQSHELLLQQLVHGPIEFIINNEVALLPLNLTTGRWQHMCVSWNRRAGAWHAYLGGELKSEGNDLATRHTIRPGGTLILGQEQGSIGSLRFEASRTLVGELSQFNVWDRPLSHMELSALAQCSTGMLGDVVPWTSRAVEVFGGVTKQPADHCDHRMRA